MSVFFLLLSVIELVAPAQDATVELLPEAQRKVLALPTLEERMALFQWDRKENGKKIRHDPLWRKSAPLVLRWKATDGETGLWEIKIAKSSDFSDARTWFHSQKKADAATGRTSGGEKSTDNVREYGFTVPRANLEIGTCYYWKVTSNVTCGQWAHGRKCACKNRKPSVESEVASFVTADLARAGSSSRGMSGISVISADAADGMGNGSVRAWSTADRG